MFDFNKSSLTGVNISELLNNDLLNFSLQVNDRTGEIIENRKEAKFNSWKFEIVNDMFIELQGSFHKYHNSGKHNYNDFAANDLLNVLTDLSTKFKINPFLATLHNLEFGVNVELPFSTKEFLNSIISYKGKEYQKREFDGQGHFLCFEFEKWYELKIYDKGFQYGVSKNLFRFEIKVKKMEYFHAKNINIHSFADLLHTTTAKKLTQLLLKAFNELLIYDNTIQPTQLKQREREIILNGRNPKHWSELKQGNPDTFKYKRKRFRELVLIHGENNIQQTVYELMRNKLSQLTETNGDTEEKISQYLNRFSIKSYPEITAPVYSENDTRTPENLKMNLPQNNTSNSMLQWSNLITVEKRVCKSCGRDISQQKKGSVFCSEKEFGKEAKKCRNKNSNPRNNYRHKEERMYGGGFLLFDINQLKQTTANC